MVERPTYHVYIVTGLSLNRVIYVGVTSQLAARIDAHRRRKADGFTARYRLWRLVYAEAFTYVRDAIARDKHQGMAARSEDRADRVRQSRLGRATSR